MRKVMKGIGWLIGGLLAIRLSFGYIDPNTGGLIFQLLAVIFASFTGIFLFFSRQIRMAAGQFRRRLGGAPTSATDKEAERATGNSADDQ